MLQRNMCTKGLRSPLLTIQPYLDHRCRLLGFRRSWALGAIWPGPNVWYALIRERLALTTNCDEHCNDLDQGYYNRERQAIGGPAKVVCNTDNAPSATTNNDKGCSDLHQNQNSMERLALCRPAENISNTHNAPPNTTDGNESCNDLNQE
jgi:hypothetical protein